MAKTATATEPPTAKSFQSCDPCRHRKIRCVFRSIQVRIQEAGSTVAQQPPTFLPLEGEKCVRCTEMELTCSFQYQVKKRGPPKGSVRRARFMKIDQEREYDHSHDRSTGANTSDHDNATAGPSSSPQFRSPISNTPLDGDLGYRPFHDLSVPSPGHAASVLDVEAHSYAIDTGFGESQSPFGVGSVYDPAMTASVGDSAVSRPYSLPSLGQEYTAQGSTPSEFERPQVPPPRPFWLVKKQSNMLTDMASPSSSSSIKGKGKERLDLEEMLPRHSALLVNELFFDYLWHLLPCLHIPTYRADFSSGRDRFDPEFLALVLSIQATVFIAVPRKWLPPGLTNGLRQLTERCVGKSRALLDESGEITVNATICHYLNVQVLFNLGNYPVTTNQTHGAVFMYINHLRLFDPASYLNLDPVETEVRRRLYWLAFGADKSMATLSDQPMMCRSSEYGMIDLPSAVEDERIFKDGYVPQPPDVVPPITGFIHISRLFAIQEEVLTLYRTSRNHLDYQDIDVTLQHLGILLDRNQSEMDGCVAPLRLKAAAAGSSLGYREVEGTIPDIDRLRDFFDTRAVRGNAFLVAQGNIYVTQQWIRYLILQCRSSLLEKSNMAYRFADDPRNQKETLHAISSDLLMVLRSIPIECIAANGLALVSKIRYIAGGLLHEPASSPIGPGAVPRQAQAILLDFLVLMSEIEKSYQLE